MRPQLVIWQVGANGAMRNANPTEFKRLVQEGVARLRKAGTEVILMDNHRSPKLLAAVEHIVLENDLCDVAQQTGVNLLSGSHLMDAWSDEGDEPGMFIAPDGLHQNDLGYRCFTQTLTRLIVEAVTAPSIAVSAHR